MYRFTSWLSVGIAAAFLVVSTAAFSIATTAWLAFAIGIGTLVVSAGVAVRHHRDIASLTIGVVTGLVGAWTIVSSLVFSHATEQNLALASALAICGLAISGLAAHEFEHDYSLASRQPEDSRSDSESRLAAAA